MTGHVPASRRVSLYRAFNVDDERLIARREFLHEHLRLPKVREFIEGRKQLRERVSEGMAIELVLVCRGLIQVEERYWPTPVGFAQAALAYKAEQIQPDMHDDVVRLAEGTINAHRA